MKLIPPLNGSDGYRRLLQLISDTYTEGRVRAVQAVNTRLIETYWQVGRVRQGAHRHTLAADLSLRHGKGFSRSNLIRFRQFYLAYPDVAAKGATLSHQLTWSHIVELLKVDDPLERGFYEQQTPARALVGARARSPEGVITLSAPGGQPGQGRDPATRTTRPGGGRAR
jgi:hypothetical protein